LRLPWPEIPSAHRPDETIRQILDYLCWITGVLRRVGYYAGDEIPPWRARVQAAYQALFLPPVPNHGDPYPPDVPPPTHPGIWPDVPSAEVPGMTLRHQLKVINIRATEIRDTVWIHARPDEVVEWDRRLSLAREALDHGEALEMPDTARTEPSPSVLAEARAQEHAMKEHARKRAARLQRLRARKKKTKKAVKKKASSPATRPSAAKKKAAAKKPKAASGAKTKKKKAAPKTKRKAGGTKKTAAKAKRKTAARGTRRAK